VSGFFNPVRRLGRAGGFGELFEWRSASGAAVAVKRLKLSVGAAAHRVLKIAVHMSGDGFGRDLIDTIMAEVGHSIRHQLRPYDLCARFADRTLIVVFAGCGVDEAAAHTSVILGMIDVWKPEVHFAVEAVVFPHDGDSFQALATTTQARMRGAGLCVRRGHEQRQIAVRSMTAVDLARVLSIPGKDPTVLVCK
jgi:hypothetical protein